MARRHAYLVTLFITGAAVIGCAPPNIGDTPEDVYYDTNCSAHQVELIRQGIALWNDAGMKYLGHQMINIVGPYDDPDGFTEDDYGDGRHVVYCGVSDDVFNYLNRNEPKNLHLHGSGTMADVLLFPQTITSDESFVKTVKHEFGHFVGLSHLYDPYALMSHNFTLNNGQLTDADIDEFCTVYDCVNQ